jgi:hypothetical protein
VSHFGGDRDCGTQGTYLLCAQNPANLTHVAMKASCLRVGLLKPGYKVFLFNVTMHVTLKNGHRYSLQKAKHCPTPILKYFYGRSFFSFATLKFNRGSAGEFKLNIIIF